tara:strand:+ start:1081 stop:1998 length:918 start_codon:yes stop_codon:yes gene_type:complete
MNISFSDIAATVREAFDFEVIKLPLTGADNHYTPWYGLFRDDSGKYVGSSSITERYTPHTTDDVCALVEAAANVFEGDVNLQCHFNDGHYVSIAPSDDYRHSVYGTDDNIFARLVISFGFDKESCVASFGGWRDACDNLMIPRMVEGTRVSIRHTRSLRSKMDDLIATFGRLEHGWQNLIAMADEMQAREVRLDEFLDAIYGQPTPEQIALANTGQKVRGVTIHENRTKAILNRVMRERWQTGRPALGSDFRVSAWEAYNAVQGHAQHDATRRTRRGNTITRFDRILLASNDSAVLQAEKLALSA